ncbi:hypothetical protein [Fictibacillus sp. NRS-1165]|uniref:hypothetical protein n=1 Tax=Fictibacillus sp. NRS-1165 TaxID=3144463 RepID=UPI003D231525
MRWIWISIITIMAGQLWDFIWHYLYGKSDYGVPLPHVLQYLGFLYGVIAAVQLRLKDKKANSQLLNVLLVSTIAALLGASWDNFYDHVNGLEKTFSPAHILLKIGLASVIVVSGIMTLNQNNNVQR